MPEISIIVPCYNEEKTIAGLLEAVHAQTFDRRSMEVVIADGMSSDGTRAAIASFIASYPDLEVRIVDNLAGTIPAALNVALAAARGEVIVRLDAHSAPYPDYIARCVESLGQGLGDNVGGVWEIRPRAPGWMAAAIAAAAAHPLGAGDARYRTSGEAGPVDTVPFGAYRKTLVDRIGGFDETLLANEDYEFNVRVRRSGGTVWFDPRIRSRYYARATLRELARQYARYGYWKVRMLRRYPGTLRWRQALPPLLVLSLLGLAALAFWLPWARALLALEVVSYGLLAALAGLHSAWRSRAPGRVIGLPLAVFTMHLAWGGAFLWSVIESVTRPRKESR